MRVGVERTGSSRPQKPVLKVLGDFDLTLGPYCQGSIFRHFKVNEADFWREKEELLQTWRQEQGYEGPGELAYLALMINYARPGGKMAGLNNRLIHDLGKELEFYPGVPDFIPAVKAAVEEDPRCKDHGLKVDFHVVTTGLDEIIRGSPLAQHIVSVHGSGFIEQDGVIAVPRLLSPYGKGEYLFTLTKGRQDLLNVEMSDEARVALKSDVFALGDGPSDIAMFRLVKKNGGIAMGVYDPKSNKSRSQNMTMLREGRIDLSGPTDYSEGSHTRIQIEEGLLHMAYRVIDDIEARSRGGVGADVGHLNAPRVVAGPAHRPERKT
ncbi:MAG: haloacid dehalogenase-like hydrolase [Candidatus Aenigmarchaeota archaeon]|nr:haloacid dehalogenase-like hydrolase [Candidatus Aenigmarchaeota archaeon]